MFKTLRRTLIAATLTVAASLGLQAANNAWPANYEGVMFQAFAWDSYDDTKWTTLTAQADELSKYFKLIWVPNSGKSVGSTSMGYMPIYWFSNHNSSFGTQGQLRTMINTFKEKGTGIIADVVINHRAGVSGWTDFPTETWNGQTWHIGTDGICRTDECNRNGHPTSGANDTGEDFDGARDLDHTNANVQNNCKNYCKFLLDELGYAGFRYDMVKGYSGQYNKMYNEYSGTKFSVGEYWDGSYDAVAGWIEATGRQSAAFDYPFKYAVNQAFGSGDMSKLVWMANGDTPQPAGLIHFGYSQYAVTFIDNHDTYRNDSKFNGNIVAANAFMLCSPGTPCVFLPHWKSNKAEISRLIEIRNTVGLHNNSTVRVLQSSRDCYMAEVTGSKGTLVVKIGSAMASPGGYSESDIAASGTNYCVWTKASIGGGGGGGNLGDDPVTGSFNVYFDNSATNWTSPYIHYWGASESTWPGVAMTAHEGNLWKYTVPEGTTGLLFNAGDGDATKTPDFVAVADHVYTTAGDGGHINDYGTNVEMPDHLYVIGNLENNSWSTSTPVEMTREGNLMYARVTFVPDGTNTMCWFNLCTVTGADWDAVNGADRYGAPTENTPITLDGDELALVKYAANVNASGCQSWTTAPCTAYVVADFAKNTVSLRTTKPAGVNDIEADAADVAPAYYTLQGVRVANPVVPGLYIEVHGNTARKILVK